MFVSDRIGVPFSAVSLMRNCFFDGFTNILICVSVI